MMGWSDNKFSSPKGQKYMNKIFDMIFAEPMYETNKLETDNLDRQVTHFKTNMLSIVNIMKKFVVGYSEVPMSEATSSGIHICPHCMRRDMIWDWEILDVGHYASPEDWVSSVEPKEWKSGLSHERGRYLFMARYKCNKVTTCNECHLTTIGHQSSCGDFLNCGSSDVKKVGCEEESYGKHFVREYKLENNHPTSREYTQAILATNRSVKNPDNRKERKEGDIIGYRYRRKKPTKGMFFNNYEEVKDYLPMIEFTYGADFNNIQGTSNVAYPISELNFALSKKRRKICRNGKDNCHQGVPNVFSETATECNQRHQYVDSNGFLQDTNDRKTCGAMLPPLVIEDNYFYSPSLMRIMSKQPLDNNSMSGRTVNGLPVYFIHLESMIVKDYKILLPLPTIETLQKIPAAPKPQVNSSSPPQCPNDIGRETMVELYTKAANEEMEETKSQLTEQLKAYYDLGPADANNTDGYTFVVCEGRSLRATFDNKIKKWIDESPQCKANGKEYARWNTIPNYADKDSDATEYLGPNPRSHFVQDFLKASESIVSFIMQPPTFHYVKGIGQRTNEAAGVIIDILECQTCKGIVEAKGIIPYRESKNECDDEGNAINGFPQAVIDAEIEYQKSYPMKNDLGEKVPTAWGIIATQKHNGKTMLKTITRYDFN